MTNGRAGARARRWTRTLKGHVRVYASYMSPTTVARRCRGRLEAGGCEGRGGAGQRRDRRARNSGQARHGPANSNGGRGSGSGRGSGDGSTTGPRTEEGGGRRAEGCRGLGVSLARAALAEVGSLVGKASAELGEWLFVGQRLVLQPGHAHFRRAARVRQTERACLAAALEGQFFPRLVLLLAAGCWPAELTDCWTHHLLRLTTCWPRCSGAGDGDGDGAGRAGASYSSPARPPTGQRHPPAAAHPTSDSARQDHPCWAFSSRGKQHPTATPRRRRLCLAGRAPLIALQVRHVPAGALARLGPLAVTFYSALIYCSHGAAVRRLVLAV